MSIVGVAVERVVGRAMGGIRGKDGENVDKEM